MDDAGWENIQKGLREFAARFPEGLVVIGGVAVYLHAEKARDERLLEISHDADYYLSLSDYADLRDLEEVVSNKRLSKHQVTKYGVEFDIYVERRHLLRIPYDDVARHSEVIGGIRCAALEHLLLLKLDAARDRQGSAKGDKDRRDVIRILLLMRSPRADRVLRFWKQEDEVLLTGIAAAPEPFLQMAGQNAKEAKHLRETFRDHSQRILEECRRALEPERDPAAPRGR